MVLSTLTGYLGIIQNLVTPFIIDGRVILVQRVLFFFILISDDIGPW